MRKKTKAQRGAELVPDPDGGELNVKATILGDVIVFVTLAHDPDTENPTDGDGMGKIHSLGRHHINRIDYEDALDMLRDDPDAVALSYFEHGNCIWSAGGDKPRGTEGDWQWDGVDFAGVWQPDKCVRESYDEKLHGDRREWFRAQAASTCEEYTKWVNGECYWYGVEAFDVRRDDEGEPYDELNDYRRVSPRFEDSCGGFIGHEYATGEAADAAARALDSIKHTNAA